MKRPQRGFSLLELQIGFVVLGIGLVGLGPLVITQVKQLRALDSQLSEKSTYYFVPSSDPWMRKLGAAATTTATAPGAATPPVQAGAANAVSVISLVESPTGDVLTATVSLTGVSQ